MKLICRVKRYNNSPFSSVCHNKLAGTVDSNFNFFGSSCFIYNGLYTLMNEHEEFIVIVVFEKKRCLQKIVGTLENMLPSSW